MLLILRLKSYLLQPINFLTMANNTRILTLNVQGLRDLNNRLVFVQWLNCVKPDIVCLQETHSTSIAEFKNCLPLHLINAYLPPAQLVAAVSGC